MKRFLWLTCLCCSMGALVGCGDDTTKKRVDDGGMSSVDGGPDDMTTTTTTTPTTGGASQKDLDALKKQVMDLATQNMMLNTDLSAAQKSIDDNAKTLSGVNKDVDKLKNPDVPSPLDGIKLAQMGILDLVEKACAYEAGCCDAAELELQYGPTVTSSQECIDTFNALVEKGVTPNFLSQSVPIVSYVVSIAAALASTEITVELNKDKIKDCTDWLDKKECAKYETPSTITTPHCTPFTEVPENPCSVDVLLQGMQDEGEICGVIYGIGGCKDGLICRNNGQSRGVCTQPVGAGSRCLDSGDCQVGLFCRPDKGECQALADEGADCEFIDPSFTSSGGISPPSDVSHEQTGLLIQCKPGLQCDPTTKKCIQSCTDGSLCEPGAGSGILACPDGKVCNVTEVPTLYRNNAPGTSSYLMGVCRDPAAAGDFCTLDNATGYPGSECDSKNCSPRSSDGKNVCQDPLAKAGDDCAANTDCETHFCGTDGKCVKNCDVDAQLGTYSCATGYYCNQLQNYSTNSVFYYVCEPLIANTDTCGQSPGNTTDATCASGFCSSTAGSKCAAKSAANGGCPTPFQNTQCLATQWCDSTQMFNSVAGLCVDRIAAGADCSGNKASACTAGHQCFTTTGGSPTTTCVATGAEGDTCVTTAPASDIQGSCTPGLLCVNTILKCYATGKYPENAPCTQPSQCESGWCKGTTNKTCATVLAADADCDTAGSNPDHCDKGLYCEHDTDNTAGKCKDQHTAGQHCEPRFGGADCLNPNGPNGSCIESGTDINSQGGSFVCYRNSIPDMTVFCDGN